MLKTNIIEDGVAAYLGRLEHSPYALRAANLVAV